MHRIVPSDTPASGNFADLVLRHGNIQPWVTALELHGASPRTVSFGELAERIQGFRQLCRQQGWHYGTPVVVMHKPTPELYITVLGLLAEGLVPIFIDTGLGPRKMLQALQLSGARHVITSVKARKIGPLLTLFKQVNWWSMDRLVARAGRIQDHSGGCTIGKNDHGLISYTSGTTGRPKGADRTHTSLIAQHQAIRNHWPDRSNDIDMTCLPVLVLHNLCCGMPTILPDMDFAAPAKTNGKIILEQIRRAGVTRISGASAFVGRVADAITPASPATSLQSIRIGGAPVGAKLARKLGRSFPEADIAVVYGSTEAEPIAHLNAADLLHDDSAGYPVGKPVPQTNLLLVNDKHTFRNELELKNAQVLPGEPGEIVVAGPHVLRGYVNDEQATRENKVPGNDGRVWHRTGDLAVMDEQGQLLLLGRRSDQIDWKGRKLPTFPIERKIQDLPDVAQAALVQFEAGARPHLFINLESGATADDVTAECKEVLEQLELADAVIEVLDRLPVDSRHNSKIQRAPLRQRCRA